MGNGAAVNSDKCSIVPGGIVWTDHGGTSQDLILMTTRGAEMYKVSAARSQCKLVRSLSYATRCFWYGPKSRLLVLGTGELGGELRPYSLGPTLG